MKNIPEYNDQCLCIGLLHKSTWICQITHILLWLFVWNLLTFAHLTVFEWTCMFLRLTYSQQTFCTMHNVINNITELFLPQKQRGLEYNNQLHFLPWFAICFPRHKFLANICSLSSPLLWQKKFSTVIYDIMHSAKLSLDAI